MKLHDCPNCGGHDEPEDSEDEPEDSEDEPEDSEDEPEGWRARIKNPHYHSLLHGIAIGLLLAQAWILWG